MRAAAVMAVVALAALALAAGGSAKSATSNTTWFWSPGYCKSMLIHKGVQFDDGRTFNVERAYCVGIGGTATCEWWHGERQYNTFTAIVRSYDGAVRLLLKFKTAGKAGFRFYDSKMLEKYASPASFASRYAPVAAQSAAQEQQKGCNQP
jgi:hypothetical protein